MEAIRYNDSLEGIHTDDAFFSNVRLRNNCLVIPYINIGITNHMLNPNEKMVFIDYSYLVAVNLSYLATWIKNENGTSGRMMTIINESSPRKMNYWGGTNLDSNSVYNGMELSCEYSFFYTTSISNLNENMWLPINTSKFIQNTDNIRDALFYSHQFMPHEIKVLIM